MQFKPPRPDPSNLMLRTVWDYFGRFFKNPEFGSPILSTYTGGASPVTKPVFAGSQVNQSVALAANYTVTTSLTTPGSFSTTFTMPVAGNVLVVASVDANGSVTGFGRIQGVLRVDGANQTPSFLYDSNGALFRLIWGMSWIIPLTAGSHTIDMQFVKNGAGGTLVANATNTAFQVLGP